MADIQDKDRTYGKKYEITIRGHLKRDWADWLEGLEMEELPNGEMVLAGVLADQAALVGVLNKLNRLNLTILAVNESERKGAGKEKTGNCE
jgi:hypothetical protein